MSEWMYWLTKYSNNFINFVGNCSSYQVLSLEQITQDIDIGHRYQFGIELTTASSCHCVTITSATESFGTNLLNNTENLWCNKILQQSFNQLCASSTTNMTFGSKVLNAKGNFAFSSYCKDQWGLIPTILLSSGDNSNTGVCPEVVNPLSPLITMTLFKSSSLVASISSSSSFHTTAEDHIFMATPTSYFPSLSSTYPTIPTLPSSYNATPTLDLSTSFLLKENSALISYSSPSSITNTLSQFTTGPINNMFSSSLVTVTTSSSVTYTLPYSSPIPTLAIPMLISASHTNHGVSQTSARSSFTSLGASPSPTMLFCSENGTWPMTLACIMANATSTDCGNNFSRAKG